MVGTSQYYSAGDDDLSDTLDPSAEHTVMITTKDRKVLQTCTSKITSKNSLQAKLYPNPVELGKFITTETDFTKKELENMQISLFSIFSQMIINKKQSSIVKTQIQFTETVGNTVNIVVIETANIKKTLKVIAK